jgi:hypothetical protein
MAIEAFYPHRLALSCVLRRVRGVAAAVSARDNVPWVRRRWAVAEVRADH